MPHSLDLLKLSSEVTLLREMQWLLRLKTCIQVDLCAFQKEL